MSMAGITIRVSQRVYEKIQEIIKKSELPLTQPEAVDLYINEMLTTISRQMEHIRELQKQLDEKTQEVLKCQKQVQKLMK